MKAEREERGEGKKHKLTIENSPAGGGFFAGNHKNGKAGGRFDTSVGSLCVSFWISLYSSSDNNVQTFLGAIYSALYLKPSIEVATANALEVAAKHGISGHAAALRWTSNHSVLDKKYGDAIIIGSSTIDQLNSNLDVIEQGPLPEDVVKAINDIYKEVGEEEIPYHF